MDEWMNTNFFVRPICSSLIPVILFPLGSYSSVSCSSPPNKCSNALNLGLLDFGAAYTVILTEVRTLSVEVNMQSLPIKQHD